MRRFIGGGGAVVGVFLTCLLAGLAGCSAPGGSPAATATSAQPDAATIWRELARCVRDNGMPDLPDPQIDSNGQPHFPEGTPEPPERARRACQPIADRLPGTRRETRPPANISVQLRFARCMREHGLTDFPDPEADGTCRFAGTGAGRELYGPRADKQPTPLFSAAMQACSVEPGIRIEDSS